MFGKLKNKLKEWASKVSEIKEESEEIIEEFQEEIDEKSEITTKEEKKGFLKKLFGKKEEEIIEEYKEDIKEVAKKETKSKKTIKPSSKKTDRVGVVDTKDIEKITDKEIDKKLKEELKSGNFEESKTATYSGMDAFEKATIPEEKPKEKTKDKEIIKPAVKETDRVGVVGTKDIEEKPKVGFFKKLLSSKKTITDKQFMEYSEDLEMILLENNVALEVSDKIIEELKNNIVGKELSKKEIQDTIESSLKEIIESVLLEPFDILEEIKNKEGPYVMIFCGINGVGKTTTIAKFANMLKTKGLTSVMAAADTFRAAAIEQLKIHGEKLDIKVIAHEYGSDPAAVGFDAVKYAKKNNIDVVLIDTAGRIHTATNLLQEMAKIKRVCKPDRTIFLGESITGNDAVDQVKAFNEHIGIDGIILSKADIDEKGGTALSVGYVTQKPILFLGTGQNYEDIEPFDKKKFIEKLGL